MLIKEKCRLKNGEWQYKNVFFVVADCMTGRFGVNCADECHCQDPHEVCHPINGTCPSGCDPKFKGANCQGECILCVSAKLRL